MTVLCMGGILGTEDTTGNWMGGILYPDGIASDGSMDRLAKVTFEIVVRVVSFE